jgi:nucleotide-binding universal stress UspA family protein
MLAIRSILYPTDFSERAECAFPTACALARDYGAELIVLHVYPPPIFAGEVMKRTPDGHDERLWAMLQRVQPPDPKVRTRHCLVAGHAATDIVRIASESKSDLIVIGAHGRTGLSRVLIGSVAEQVLRTSPCPVLVVKAPFPETPLSDKHS